MKVYVVSFWDGPNRHLATVFTTELDAIHFVETTNARQRQYRWLNSDSYEYTALELEPDSTLKEIK